MRSTGAAPRYRLGAMGAELTSTVGIVALAAGVIALLALGLAAVLYRQLRRLRADQRAVLGDQEADLVAHAATLDASFRALHEYVTEVAKRLDGRVSVAEQRLDGAIAHWGLIRYDAYNEMSGRQSTSIALLDSSRSGVVLSSIHHRDQARLYAKQVDKGRGELRLSPEEEEALRLALSERDAARAISGPKAPSPRRPSRSAPEAADAEFVALPTVRDTIMAVARRHGRPGRRPDRELARGRGRGDASTRSPTTTPTSSSSARSWSPCRPA